MENQNKSWFPRANRRLSISTHSQQKNEHNRINNFIDCKLHKIPTKQIEEQLAISRWRFQTDYPIFKVLHFSYESIAKDCVISKIVYEVPEHLIHKIARPLSIFNCLYTLKTIFMACQKLVEEFSFFKLTQKMIGVTHDKTCKVWINENFYKNEIMYRAQSEEEMIFSIIQIIERLIVMNPLEQKLITQLRQEKQTLVRMSQLVWKFSYENSILIPPFFEIKQTNQNNQSMFKKTAKHQKTASNFQVNNLNKWEGDPYSTHPNKQNKFNEFDMQTNRTKKKQKQPMRNNSLVICFKQKNPLKLNKSSQIKVFGALTSRYSRSHSKSDFIARQFQRRKSSFCRTDKQNLTKTSSNKVPQSQRTPTYKDANRYQQTKEKSKVELNKLTMKNMIKQKLRFNRQKKRVVQLQAINTVKSIGQFTESQKRIIESNSNSNLNNIDNLQRMGRKIQKSYFHIQLPDLQSSSSISVSNQQYRKY